MYSSRVSSSRITTKYPTIIRVSYEYLLIKVYGIIYIVNLNIINILKGEVEAKSFT